MLVFDVKVERISTLLGLFALIVASQFYKYAHVSVQVGLRSIEVECSYGYIPMVS